MSFFERHRPAGLHLFLWCGLATLPAAASCNRVDCPVVCERVRQCKGQVSDALVARQPSQSRFMKHVRNKLPERLIGRLIKSCPERCDALGKDRTWRKRLRACEALQNCDAFARCVAPALEP